MRDLLLKVREQRYERVRACDRSFTNFTNEEMKTYLEVYDKNIDDGFNTASQALVTAGCIMLFCNWLMFNGGSSFSISSDKENNRPAEVIVTTTVCGAAGCIGTIVFSPMTAYFLKNDDTNRFDLVTAGAGLLSGCVSITAGCATVSLLSAAIIGVLGCLVYLGGKVVWRRVQIDDPLEASQIHGLCGCWGLIAAGLFDRERGLLTTG